MPQKKTQKCATFQGLELLAHQTSKNWKFPPAAKKESRLETEKIPARRSS
jgi:hypothetical protein